MRGVRAPVGALLLAVLAAGCGEPAGQPAGPPASGPSAAATTQQPLPGGGGLTVELRQYSHGAARDEALVWIDNETADAVSPRSIVYRDPRLPRPVPAENMRTIPAGSYRGFTIPLPARPACEVPASGTGSVVLRHDGGVERLAATDPHEVIAGFLESRCAELSLAEVVELRWLGDIPVDEPGQGATGTLTLLASPTGASGREVVIERIHETHLLGAGGATDAWEPGTRISGDDPPTRIELPLRPSRCDEHAFQEGGNATAFRVEFTLDGDPGEIRLRMRPRAAGAAMDFALAACGYEP